MAPAQSDLKPLIIHEKVRLDRGQLRCVTRPRKITKSLTDTVFYVAVEWGHCWVRFYKLLVVGATSVIRRARTGAIGAAPWIRSLLERRPARVVTVAMANKTARIVWAVLVRGDAYRTSAMAA